ncbi:MAG: Fe2+-dependent dioxygenase [Janthinobacterium lividum]
MLLAIPDVLAAGQVAQFRAALDGAAWIEGRATAGYQAARVKDNAQLDERHPLARQLGQEMLGALERSKLFISAALPLRVYPPMFNRYAGGQTFGTHIDTAIRQDPTAPVRVRADLSATLFLSEPGEYEGGELVVQDTYGAHAVKLPAGSLVLYPSSSLHHVNPVTSGARLGSFMWIQSMVRDNGGRTLLYDLDSSIQHLAAAVPSHPALVQLTGVYHNLLRRWVEC